MSVLVVGVSHRTAPLALLERAALGPDRVAGLEAELCRDEHIAEAVVLRTCNRLEVYAEVSKFHGGVAAIGGALAEVTGVPLDELTDHLYVHYDDSCVRHLFAVACGLESMAIGESQILGQLRAALRSARSGGSVGRSLGRLLENALRVGKRAHAETSLDRAGPGLVEAALERAAERLGPLTDARLLVIGAGSISGLVVATAARAGVASIAVSSRTERTAARLAESVGGAGVPIAELPAAIAAADLVVACAGAPGFLVATADAAAAGGRRQVYVDLALPRDVEPGVGALPGVTLLDLEVLGRDLAARGVAADLAEVRELVAAEVAGYLAGVRAEAVAPAVVELRAMANSVVAAELARLESRLDGVEARIRQELARTVHRVVEKLLHTPTVRVKELAAEPGASSYAEALRTLFGLGSVPPDGAMPTEREEPRMTAGVEGSDVLRLRLGTRRSPLAISQSAQVADELAAALDARDRKAVVELVEVTTHGDVTGAPLAGLGGTGVFVSALRDALLAGTIDLAVHSLKDLPTAPAEGITLAAVPAREDPRDVLVARDGLRLADLPAGARIGTGSPRRAAQLRAFGLGHEVVGVRGNVDTRLAKVAGGGLDAVVLARAGLLRLGRADEATEVFDPRRMLPAPGQGALAVECRSGDHALIEVLGLLDDPATRLAVTAERALLARLEAGCAAPVGALAEVVDVEGGRQLTLRAVVATPDGSRDLRRSAVQPLTTRADQQNPPDPGIVCGHPALHSSEFLAAASAVGVALAEQLLADGAADLMPPAAGPGAPRTERQAGKGDL